MRTIFATALFILLVSISLFSQEATLKIPDGTNENYFLSSDSIRLHYLVSGKGPAIIFIPGWLMPAEIWEKQIAYFSKTNFVVALDPRCQGKSSQATDGVNFEREAKDLKELTEHLKLSSYYLVGWSWAGAMLYTYLDLYNSSSLKGIIVVDAPLKINETLLDLQASRIRGFLYDRVVATDRFVSSMYKQPHTETYLRRVMTASYITPTNTAITLLSNFFISNDSTWTSTLKNSNKPVLYIGTESKADLLKEINRTVKIEYTLIPEAGHALFVDKPDEFNKILEKFITR